MVNIDMRGNGATGSGGSNTISNSGTVMDDIYGSRNKGNYSNGGS